MTLLERMAEEPRTVLETLNPTEQERVITELGVLAERAAGVQAEADLLYVADAVHRMVEETPALGVLLLQLVVATTRYGWWQCCVCPAHRGPATPDAALCCSARSGEMHLGGR